jgi:hypothetical protein
MVSPAGRYSVSRKQGSDRFSVPGRPEKAPGFVDFSMTTYNGSSSGNEYTWSARMLATCFSRQGNQAGLTRQVVAKQCQAKAKHALGGATSWVK